MELRTYTDLWRMDRRLYAIQDVQLPVPVGMTQLASAAVTALLWLPLASTLGLTGMLSGAGDYASGLSAIVLAGPPVAVGWATGRPLVEGRTVGQHLFATVRCQLLPTHLVRLDEPPTAPSQQRVHGRAWLPTSEQGRR